MLAQYKFLTFFDALHASVALSNKLSMVSNDPVYNKLGIKNLSFRDFLNLLESKR